MTKSKRRSSIYVVAGVNGAGKSSIAGEMLLLQGVPYFNPDEAAKRIRSTLSGITKEESEIVAWQEGKRLLERAILERLDFAFETTLGGRTIAGLLEIAIAARIEVRIWYVGLASPELHIQRVRARVSHGGHDIPEQKIRDRYEHSILNLIRLLPGLTELWVYDNSIEADPHAGKTPELQLILHLRDSDLIETCELDATPEWAKPILISALRKKS